jgi:hypothetical protein
MDSKEGASEKEHNKLILAGVGRMFLTLQFS